MNTSGSRSPHNAIAETVDNLPRSGIRDFFDIVSSMHDVISLGVGEPSFVTPWHIREASIFALEHGATGYTSNLGLVRLRQGISSYLENNFDLAYDPDQEIIITVGVSEALDLAVRALINPGEGVAYHEPCYVSYAPLISLAHGIPQPVVTSDENGFALQADDLRAVINDQTKVLILNYPNNPTGGVLSKKEAEGIAEVALEHDLIVITDEVYAELSYEKKHTSIATLPGMKERTLFLHGFSKAWAMTGFRLGYACGPAHLIEAMMKIHQYTMLCAPILSQEAAIDAIQNANRDVAEMRDAYQKHRNYMYNAFEEIGLPCGLPGGAFYTFPRIDELGLTAKDFALQLLEEEKVAVVPGTAFGACGEGHVRCSYATALDDIKVAMERMAAFIGRLRS